VVTKTNAGHGGSGALIWLVCAPSGLDANWWWCKQRGGSGSRGHAVGEERNDWVGGTVLHPVYNVGPEMPSGCGA
jgi:hypothetical protein